MLNLANTNLIELPENIGKCKKLKNLNLSQTKIKYLPENIEGC